MAQGNCTGEMPSFDLRACSEAKKRPFSSDGSESLFEMLFSCPRLSGNCIFAVMFVKSLNYSNLFFPFLSNAFFSQT